MAEVFGTILAGIIILFVGFFLFVCVAVVVALVLALVFLLCYGVYAGIMLLYK